MSVDVVAGTRIGDRWVIERALAKGGMGAVYVAFDEQMHVRVALKVTTAGGGAGQDVLATRFAREARIGNRLGSRHRGFVRALGWGRIDATQLYLIMDLVEGARPLDLLEGTRDERVRRWRSAADLVRVAHEQGVIHRDLKPANFLQAPDGSIFLTDFGLAKVVGEAAADEVSVTMTGVGFGTPPYMPPEQLEDAKHADQRADVFALGCMLFEAAVTRLPYPGPGPTGVLSAHVKVRAGVVPAPRPRDVDASVPDVIDQACLRALELDVARRAPSVAAVFALLDGGAAPPVEVAPPQPAKPLGSAAPPPGGGSKRAPVAIAALLLLVAGGALVLSKLAPTERPPEVTVTERALDVPARPVALLDLSPQTGAVVSALTVDVTGRIEPPAAAVRVAGIVCRLGADGTFALRRLGLEPGANEIPVEVQPDAPGQEPLRRTIVLMADADDPRLMLEAPADGLETIDDSVEVLGRVDDATAVEVSLDGELVARVKEGGGRIRARVSLPSMGSRTIEVVARDAGGRTTRVTRTVVRRAARLELTLDAPTDDLETNAPDVRVAGRVTGDAAPGSLEVRIAGATCRSDASGAFEQTLPLAEGAHVLEVEATARSVTGEPIAAVGASRRVRVDRTAPTLRLLAPADGEVLLDGPIDVRAEIADVSSFIDVTLGAGAPTRLPRGQRFSGRVTLPVGVTEVVVVAVDAAGNRGEARRRVALGSPVSRPLPWSRGPERLAAGVKRGSTDGDYVNERDGSVLVYVPPGTFRMGDEDYTHDAARPVHEVRLTRGYLVGKHEVTWAQFRRFCEATGRAPPRSVIERSGRFEAEDSHPVFNVSWDDAQAYCEWAGLRLPSEAEWEHAARGSDGRTRPWGNEEAGTSRANLDGDADGHDRTAPVGSFAAGASPFGALDLLGNVAEWVQDWHGEYPADAQTDPSGPATGTHRVDRGGGWLSEAWRCEAMVRDRCPPRTRDAAIGFRVARFAEDPR